MAFSTTGKLIPEIKTGGTTFVPALRIGSTNVSGAGHTAQTGRLWHIAPGLLMFHARCVISSKESLTGNLAIRLPATDDDGNTIPVPVFSAPITIHLTNTSNASVDQYSARQPGSLSIELWKRVGATSSNATDADVFSTFSCDVSGIYGYTP